MQQERIDGPTLFGHPTGLYTLFFAEMWERFSYYGMRALLVFYMIKGFLGLNDKSAYAIYGAYGALVYATPYIGGMLADRLLGPRRAVVLGGLLMAGGHLLMTVQNTFAFFCALALLIAGNGFFKPNISTIVGSLYPAGSTRRDSGFTIFYMGINLGAAMSPIICGYIGETYGWHYGFGLATVGMLIGLAVFVAPTRLTQVLISGGALATAVSLLFLQDSLLQLAVRVLIGAALVAAGAAAFVALERGGLPQGAGACPNPEALRRKVGGILPMDLLVYLAVLLSIPLIALLVQFSAVAGWTLIVFGGVAFVYLLLGALRSPKIERERMFVVLILMFFSMLFWAFFEQAGSSVNNFTDRNVDRVFEAEQIVAEDVGRTLSLQVSMKPGEGDDSAPRLTQEQLGRVNADPAMAARIAKLALDQEEERRADELKDPKTAQKTREEIDTLVLKLSREDRLTMTGLTYLRGAAAKDDASSQDQILSWTVDGDNLGMGVGGAEIPASEFQATNPIFIILFGLLFSALWTFLGAREREPSTPLKFALGLMQLGAGFGVLWYGAQHADARGMVSMTWLLLGYLLHTTGELCLSPVGLSMVTKLSPKRLVSTIMGAWFLATAFSNYLASMIAALTGVGHGEGGAQFVPVPTETVQLYGDVFGTIALTALGSAVFCLALAPVLSRWMHVEEAME